jgi:hypothetical protein
METSSAELLAQLEKELQPLKTPLGLAADTIFNENVSNYPIFIVHQQEVEIGIPMIDKDKHGSHWSINASTLEEFATKNLIEMGKVQDFKKVFKPVKNHVCLFVLSELGATFVFLPRN